MKNQPPELDEYEVTVYNCMVDVSSERTMNGTIPFSAIIRWGQFYKVPQYIVADYIDIITIVDYVVSKWQQQRK